MQDRIRLAALLALPAIAVFAQDLPHTSAAPSSAVQWVGAGAVPVAGPAFTGAPYSAEEVTERVQTLADGTRITHESTAVRIYRDSEGRTRTEHTILRLAARTPDRPEAPVMIVITDPPARVMYTFSTAHKVARKRQLRAPQTRPLRRSGTPDPERPTTFVEQLGNQIVEGVAVEGTRRTTTWPPGSRGNDRPITVVNETWSSPELRVVVLSRENDPVKGDSTRKLTNITRGEPDPALFQPPADYTVVTQDMQRVSPN